MIDKIGVKTTIRELVAYKTLKPGENEVAECAKLNRVLYERGAKPRDPTMVLFYDPKDDPGSRREVIVPIDRKVEGVDTKMMPEIKVAFLVFIGTKMPVEHYYEELYRYIEERGLRPSPEMCSIEAVYQPAEYGLSYGSFIDEDTPEHWSTEIMIPVQE
ncbi:MAG: GyrI-like domain-containing protein [Candidatus Bathyarchaeota archaeon]